MTAAFPPPIPSSAASDKLTQVFVAKTRVDLTGSSEVLAQLQKALRDGAGMKVIHTLNPEICMQALRNPAYADTLNGGDLNVVDGVGLQKVVQSIAGQKVDRICGSDLIYDLAGLAQMAGRSVFLLGGHPDRLAKAQSALSKLYPGLSVHGLSPAFSPTLPLPDHDQIMARIRDTHPGVLAVCLGAPRQELWIAQNRTELAACGVSIATGLGGTVDFLSGEVRRAPKWMRKTGLEWSFRLLQDPRRLRRQLANLPEFALRARFDAGFVAAPPASKPTPTEADR